MITNKDLDFFITNGYNVLFEGKHGVGKTATIIEAFNRNNLTFKMFSASTMDPWVDFIGIPKERSMEDGTPYLDLVRPKEFQLDTIEAIFLDEYNRAPAKIRNAVMELIQFKSINGYQFKNLKIVWAAINPAEDGDSKYDVEELDPAQIDRFHAKVNIEYAPDKKYFKKKYGELGECVVEWWNSINENNQNKISPRRLDYMVDVYQKGGNLNYLVDKSINLSSFYGKINSQVAVKLFDKAIKTRSKEDIEAIFSNSQYCDILENKILANLGIFSAYIPDEKLTSYLNKGNADVIRYFKLNVSNNMDFIKEYIRNSKNSNRVITELSPIYNNCKSILSKVSVNSSNTLSIGDSDKNNAIIHTKTDLSKIEEEFTTIDDASNAGIQSNNALFHRVKSEFDSAHTSPQYRKAYFNYLHVRHEFSELDCNKLDLLMVDILRTVQKGTVATNRNVGQFPNVDSMHVFAKNLVECFNNIKYNFIPAAEYTTIRKIDALIEQANTINTIIGTKDVLFKKTELTWANYNKILPSTAI